MRHDVSHIHRLEKLSSVLSNYCETNEKLKFEIVIFFGPPFYRIREVSRMYQVVLRNRHIPDFCEPSSSTSVPSARISFDLSLSASKLCGKRLRMSALDT